MASARSFNMLYWLLQIGINSLIMAYAGRLRLSGLKSELVKDRYVVLSQCHHLIAQRNTKSQHAENNQNTKTQKHKNTKTQPKQNTKPKKQTTRTKPQRDRYQFMGESG